MPATTSLDSFESAARGFRDLALRRHAYYLDLLQSGRWQHYFTEQQFAERLREVMAATRTWNGLANASDDARVPQGAKSAA
jgi:hypothetical protein